jgi:hypothetical protein
VKTIKIIRCALMAVPAMAAFTAPLGLAAPAHADDYVMFQSPSGNIRCHLDEQHALAMCQIRDFTYPAPAAAVACPTGAEPGSDFRLDQGGPASLPCRYAALDSGYSGAWPTLDYGQTRSQGTITCASEQAGIRCTDSSTGHFFLVSRNSYQLG